MNDVRVWCSSRSLGVHCLTRRMSDIGSAVAGDSDDEAMGVAAARAAYVFLLFDNLCPRQSKHQRSRLFSGLERTRSPARFCHSWRGRCPVFHRYRGWHNDSPLWCGQCTTRWQQPPRGFSVGPEDARAHVQPDTERSLAAVPK